MNTVNTFRIMNIEELRNFCLSLSSVTENIKWGNDLCFLIGEKMFCITGLSGPVKFSVKVKEDEFEELITHPGIMPAPYLARHKWILVEDPAVWSRDVCEGYIRQSYELVKSKLPKKVLNNIPKT